MSIHDLKDDTPRRVQAYLQTLADEAVEADYVGCVTIVTTRDGVLHVTSDRARDFRTVAGELISALFDAAHQAQTEDE